MAIDLSKPSSTYDAAAQQPRLTQSQLNIQQQQRQQEVQSGVLTPSGGPNTTTLPNGQTVAQPAQQQQQQQQLPNFEGGILHGSGGYGNDGLLSDVLPSDGGSGEASLAGANAAANEFLNKVDFSNPLFAFKPINTPKDTNTPLPGNLFSANQPAHLGDPSNPDDATTKNNSDYQSGFTQGAQPDDIAQRLVQAVESRAQQQAHDAGQKLGDPSDPNQTQTFGGASVNTQDRPKDLEPEQGSTSAQQKARESANLLTRPNGGKNAAGELDKEKSGMSEIDGKIVDPELAGQLSELNALLKQQIAQQNSPRAKALLALLRGEQGVEEALEGSAHEVLTAHEASLLESLVGEAGSLTGASVGDLRGALTMRGEAAALGQAAERALDAAVMNNTRALTMLMSNMPAGSASQPVLAMIAADIFRLQTLRLELMASSRCADEDGEMPPVDEDEAAMRQRQVQGINLGEMWRWDLRPDLGAELEEEEEEQAQVWFRTALLTCALQRPNVVAPMFQSNAEAHSVRLYSHDEEQQTFSEQWVQIPGRQEALEDFNINSEHFVTWVNLAEQAFAHAKLAPRPVVSDDRAKNAKAQATALEAIVGKPAYALVREIDEDEETRRTFFKAICRSNAPKSLPTVITTREATFKDDGLKPGFAYGVLGAFVKDDIWSVILCEDRASDPNGPAPPTGADASDKAFRVFSVPYQAVQRNAAAVVFLPG